MSVRIPPVAVLKNRGVPASVHLLVTDEHGTIKVPYERQFDGAGEDAGPRVGEVFVQFTNSVLADLEDADTGFGSIEAWQLALGTHPFRTLCRTLAIALEWWVPGASTSSGGPVPDLRRAGKSMLDGQSDDYATIVGTAFAMANGITPEQAGNVLRAGIRNAAELRPLIGGELDKMLEAEEAAIQRAREHFATPTSPPAEPTLGVSGSPVGSVSDVTPPSSGG